LRTLAAILFAITTLIPFTAIAQQAATSLPSQKLGPDDLLSIQVYNFPEFTRIVRVSAAGTIQIPLLKKPIEVAGKLPFDIENDITEALRSNELVVNPAVTVAVVEYASRPISVVGAVKNPVTFQAIGRVTLVDAIIRAGGLAPEAGPEILVNKRPSTAGAANGDSKPMVFTQHISAHALLTEDSNESNIILTGGEEIRVPPAGKIYVVGNVKAPGAFPVTDNSDTTVMKALSLSGGVGSYYSAQAYIIRRDEPTGTKHKIPIELKQILAQKAPDYPLLADDILFIPDDSKRRQTAVIMERLFTFGAAIGAGLIIYTAGR
jgi:polysaccharide biosynthesis/export protein